MGKLTADLPLVIVPAAPKQRQAARDLARRLNLPVVDSKPDPSVLKLLLTEQRLELHCPPLGNPVFADFVGGAMGYCRRREQLNRHLLARAVGLKPRFYPQVVDATAGLGRDAFILAACGCSVRLLERSPLIAILLEDGLTRARRNRETASIAARMQLIQADSIIWMEGLDPEHCPEVIYLDPMYPERRKSALVKKEMRLLRLLVEKGEHNPGALLGAALGCARQRVVVKRPRLAPAAKGPPPDFAITGKNTRFDVYLVPKF